MNLEPSWRHLLQPQTEARHLRQETDVGIGSLFSSLDGIVGVCVRSQAPCNNKTKNQRTASTAEQTFQNGGVGW